MVRGFVPDSDMYQLRKAMLETDNRSSCLCVGKGCELDRCKTALGHLLIYINMNHVNGLLIQKHVLILQANLYK